MTTDYKNTLNLPNTAFPMKANLAQKEIELLAFWEQKQIYREMQKKDRKKSYILHDGPPYANGNIHLGHALNKILKDMIVKYKSMRGYYSPYVPGWDCHGLPIEHQVDKNLGAKKEGASVIEKRKLCRAYASKFLDIQREEFKRLGVFGDWADSYITMAFSYEASIVREFNTFVQRGYVYKGKKPVHWCPTCVTALAEAEVEYADKESPSIYVKFRVKNPKGKFTPDPAKGTHFVIWTTTPWTLPANLALALHPKFIYRIVQTPDGELILAQDLIKDCMEKIGYKENDYTITAGGWSGAEIEGIVCRHPWIDREVKTILGEHVTLEQGTGVVHTAPGHGEEDYEMGLKYGLDVYAPVDKKGNFTDEVEGFAGHNVFKANQGIINKLKELHAILGSPENITHSYPHCWRCKRPVLFRATEQWFISMEKNSLRAQALEEIKKTAWIPQWGMDRIYGMVENRPDWCISRQRSWGVPIALFQCKKCKDFINDKRVMDRIEQEVAKAGADVWFEKTEAGLLPEGYKCSRCGSQEFSKEMDILDVWFDSGVSHAAVMEADQRLSSPADLYLEGSDQHRGWFQSSLLTSVGTRNRAPYQAVLTHGFVVDGQGKKMSKSLGNVISPQEITKKHGAEILRLWTSSADYREDMRISNEIIARLVEAYRKIRNTCRFLLGNINDLDPSIADLDKFRREDFLEIDRYALSRLQGLIKKVSNAYETFAFHEVYHSIYQFCVIDMSSFYLDILKDRLYTFKSDSRGRRAAQVVLYNILISLTKMLAPILSFTAEEIWRHIPGKKEDSVFLSAFPRVNPGLIDSDLEGKWENLSKIRDEVNKALEIKRQEKFIGNALEARVVLYVGDQLYRSLNEYKNFLPTLFIVSSAELIKDENIPEAAYRSPELKDLAIIIEKAEGNKCQRCWNWDVTVRKNEKFPELCKKCCEVIAK
ncbi:MAG: isoleucine--tRNA ligase [Nitrospirae bacterium]|nr:isoleucine--tRNA ligase [Nitrospirota bacterium]